VSGTENELALKEGGVRTHDSEEIADTISDLNRRNGTAVLKSIRTDLRYDRNPHTSRERAPEPFLTLGIS